MPTNATLPLVCDCPIQGVYRTRRGYPPLRNGEVVRFRLELEDEQGHQYTLGTGWMSVCGLARILKVQGERPSSTEAANPLAVSGTMAFNIGDADVDRAVVRF
ncbi:MAG: hypothetical protein Q9P14_03205 [candidate division KSB1 bacterium]|nr:hypothetical protein [candidate division KSB1 bacterium]